MSSYIPIASQTLSSSASSVTFSSIPTTLGGKTLRDLVLVVSGSGTATVILRARFNGDTGSNYSFVRMLGDGSTAASGSGTANNFIARSFNTIQGQLALQIFDFAQTDKHKSFLSRTDVANLETAAQAGRWASTSAITSILIYVAADNFAAGSTFSLYGIEG